jgi:hypothetical protein
VKPAAACLIHGASISLILNREDEGGVFLQNFS